MLGEAVWPKIRVGARLQIVIGDHKSKDIHMLLSRRSFYSNNLEIEHSTCQFTPFKVSHRAAHD
jgi:hypothetical protein